MRKNLGKISICPTGAWDETINYTTLDAVSYRGSAYVAKQDSIGILPTNSDYWMALTEFKNVIYLSASKTTIKSGSEEIITFTALPVPDNGDPIIFELYNSNSQKVTPNALGIATYNGASLNTQTGILTTSEYDTNFQISVVAKISETLKSVPVTINILGTVRATELIITGDSTIEEIKDYHYTIETTPANTTESIVETEVSVDKVEIPLEFFYVTGPQTITKPGTYTYTFNFSPANFNIGIKDIEVIPVGFSMGTTVENISRQGFDLAINGEFPEYGIVCDLSIIVFTDDGELQKQKFSIQFGEAPENYHDFLKYIIRGPKTIFIDENGNGFADYKIISPNDLKLDWFVPVSFPYLYNSEMAPLFKEDIKMLFSCYFPNYVKYTKTGHDSFRITVENGKETSLRVQSQVGYPFYYKSPIYYYNIEQNICFSGIFSLKLEIRENKDTHTIGEIYCSDGTYITPTLDWTDGTCTSIDLNGKTPIGIVVIPGSHTPDGLARIMSLSEFGSDPNVNYIDFLTSGGITDPLERKTVEWGNNLSLTEKLYSKSPIISSELPNDENLSSEINDFKVLYQMIVFCGTKWQIGNYNTQNNKNNAYYSSDHEMETSFGMKMFPRLTVPFDDTDPNKVLKFFTNNINGQENTEALTTEKLIGYSLSENYAITGLVSFSEGNGAICPFYMPSIIEWTYVVYHLKIIQSIISKLNELNSNSAMPLDISGDTYYWSSSLGGILDMTAEVNANPTDDPEYLLPFGVNCINLGNGYIKTYNSPGDSDSSLKECLVRPFFTDSGVLRYLVNNI